MPYLLRLQQAGEITKAGLFKLNDQSWRTPCILAIQAFLSSALEADDGVAVIA